MNRIRECVYTPGGKGLNVSKPAAIAGAKVVATGFVGGHAGNYIEDELKPFGIECAFYHMKQESRSCINIWDSVQKVQTEFLEPGFEVSPKDFEGFVEQFKELVKNADIVVMSGSVPRGLDETAYQKLVKIVKDAGKKVILDTSGKLLIAGIEATKQIHADGVEIVAVSLGGDGSVVVCEEGTYRAYVPRIDAVNTVGCGDSMIAGFALGMSENLSIEDTLRTASAISAVAALREETGFFVMDDMKKIYDLIKIERKKIS